MPTSTKIIRFPKEEDLLTFERKTAAGEAIKPGMILIVSSGEWAKHASAADTDIEELIVALRKPDTNVDTAFADGETVRGAYVGHGVLGQGVLASGQNVADQDLLEADGAGALTAVTTGKPIARAQEAVDASGGAARIEVTWLNSH